MRKRARLHHPAAWWKRGNLWRRGGPMAVCHVAQLKTADWRVVSIVRPRRRNVKIISKRKKKKRRRKRRQWFSPKCQRSKEKMILSFLDGGTCLTLVKSPRPSHHFLSLLASYFFFYFSFISWQWFYIYIYIYVYVCVCVCIVPSSLGTSCRRH